MRLAGAQEIAAMLDVSRQRVQQLVRTPDFPAPLGEIAAGKVWLRDDVEAWARSKGRRIFT